MQLSTLFSQGCYLQTWFFLRCTFSSVFLRRLGTCDITGTAVDSVGRVSLAIQGRAAQSASQPAIVIPVTGLCLWQAECCSAGGGLRLSAAEAADVQSDQLDLNKTWAANQAVTRPVPLKVSGLHCGHRASAAVLPSQWLSGPPAGTQPWPALPTPWMSLWCTQACDNMHTQWTWNRFALLYDLSLLVLLPRHDSDRTLSVQYKIACCTTCLQ